MTSSLLRCLSDDSDFQKVGQLQRRSDFLHLWKRWVPYSRRNCYHCWLYMVCTPITHSPALVAQVCLFVSRNLYSGSNGSNAVFSFLPSTGAKITSFSGDINLFLKYLTANGYISASQYLVTAQGELSILLSSFELAVLILLACSWYRANIWVCYIDDHRIQSRYQLDSYLPSSIQMFSVECWLVEPANIERKECDCPKSK